MAIALPIQTGPHAAADLVQATAIEPATIKPATIAAGNRGSLLSR